MSKDMGKENLPPCKICKKVWKREETDKYVYHESVGIVCRHHHGVQQWYDELIAKENKTKTQ